MVLLVLVVAQFKTTSFCNLLPLKYNQLNANGAAGKEVAVMATVLNAPSVVNNLPFTATPVNVLMAPINTYK
jgi:hypothetical protein